LRKTAVRLDAGPTSDSSSPTGRRFLPGRGANRESDRLSAGHALEDTLRWFEKSQIRYHLVAHSHGGNVVLHALKNLPGDPRNLGAVIFLDTPFLDFGEQREPKLLFTRRFPLAVHLLAFGFSCWAVIASQFRWLALGCTAVTGSLVWRPPLTTFGAGIWQLIHFVLLDWLARYGQSDWSRVVVDGSSYITRQPIKTEFYYGA
jgi:hypothetical protein